MKRPVNRCLGALLAAALCVSGGCVSASRTTAEPLVAPQYAPAFEAAKQVLLEYRFPLERVDARHGVITTQAKATAGFGSPWDREQSSIRQEAEELINQELRRVRVEFLPAASAVASQTPANAAGTLTPVNTPDADLQDLRGLDQPMRVAFTVTVTRLHRPGRQPSTMSIRTSNMFTDPGLVEKGLAPLVSEDLGRDAQLESRLEAALERRLARSIPAPAPTPAPTR